MLDWLRVGVEYNPGDAQGSFLANARLLDETESRPAIIAGTSSDRIGTPWGQAFYLTASKNLENETGLPVAPYLGASYGTFDNYFRPIGGLVIRWEDFISTTHFFDGVNPHHMLTFQLGGGHQIGLIWVDQRDVGITYSTSFDF